MLVAAMVAASVPARAAIYYDGNELYEICSQPGPTFCLAYVSGVVDAWEMGNNPECIRAGVNNKQLMDVVVNYLKARPQVRDSNASIVVKDAIRSAFCPNGPG